ncbi:hypothetical protein [Arthrobacter sp. fls2-241-R2A-200]|uniref:hypothetical protein n=1 Tax=Arthrobacter sp. fls2-241-R2A-200 TaxID=3040281 RepID=UPI00254DA0FE|nr:hypothetical protein [Arthrobacter sp. fls2-241-R2A-200]
MTANHEPENIDAGLARHLAESMGQAPMPAPATIALALGNDQGAPWPDGNGKHRHHLGSGADPGHGRLGQGAAVTAVHRTSRPQMPHSS